MHYVLAAKNWLTMRPIVNHIYHMVNRFVFVWNIFMKQQTPQTSKMEPILVSTGGVGEC